MSDNIVDFSLRFSDAVLRHFDAKEDEEKVALHLLFQEIVDESGLNVRNQMERSLASERTISEAEFRWSFYRTYRDDFLKIFEPAFESALPLAVICDYRTHEIHVSSDWGDDEEDIPDIALPHMVSEDTIIQARMIYEHALAIETQQSYDPEEAPPEAFFLAHVNTAENCFDILKNFSSFDTPDLIDIWEREIVAARKFIDTGSQAGMLISSLLDRVEYQIHEKLKEEQSLSLSTGGKILPFPSAPGL